MNEEYTVHLVLVAEIIAGDNDRITFDEKKLRALADSIATDGLSTPITLVPIADGDISDGKRFRIAAGERRFRAMSTILKWERVPAFIRAMDAEAESVVMLHENTGRENLNPMEESDAYQKRMDDFGWDEATVADRAGATEAHVRARLRLQALIPEARELVAKGQLPIGHAEEMASVDAALQREAVKLLGRTAVPFVTFKQFLNQLIASRYEQSAFDLVAFWAEQIQQGSDAQAAMRQQQSVIHTSDRLPPVPGDKSHTAGDIITRYMQDLYDAGHMEGATAVGNLLKKLLSLRKVKNFRERL